MGGTWELIDKEFSSSSSVADTTAYFELADSSVPCTFSWVRSGHTLHTRFIFYSDWATLTGNMTNSVGYIDFDKFFVSDLCFDKYSVGISPEGDAIFQSKLDNDGTVYIYDIFGKTKNEIDINKNCFVDFTHTITHEYMKDEACDKFYWKRTA
jgi:hypothetical protein